MASIRELKTRIKSVSSTKKITKAQELIATSRIMKAQARVNAALPYAQEMTKALSSLSSAATNLSHILIAPRQEVKRSGILIITSDRGMCGAYNSNVIKEAEALAKLLREQNKTPVFFVFGSKGISYCQFKEIKLSGAWSGFSQDPSADDVRDAQIFLQKLLVEGSDKTVNFPQFKGIDPESLAETSHIAGIDELYLVSSHFVSMMSQEPQVRRLAPLEVEVNEVLIQDGDGLSQQKSSPKDGSPQYEFEPEPNTLLNLLLPRYLSARIFAASLDAAASESASRRAAMKSATDNATDLEKSLKRQANLARQAQITNEISEIVGTTAALSD